MKNWDRREFVIGGWIPVGDKVASLVFGELECDRLVYRGEVEYVLSGDIADALKLIARERSPFEGQKLPRDVRHVEPKFVAECKCMAGEHGVRHARLLEVRVRRTAC